MSHETPLHWHVGDDGLAVYRNGALLATIPVEAYLDLIARMALVARKSAPTEK